MAHVFYCKDVGIDCAAEIRGTDTEDVLRKAAEHGRKEHGIEQLSPEMRDTIRRAVKEEPSTA